MRRLLVCTHVTKSECLHPHTPPPPPTLCAACVLALGGLAVCDSCVLVLLWPLLSVCRQYSSIQQELHTLAESSLVQLHLEVRCHCFYFLLPIVQKVRVKVGMRCTLPFDIYLTPLHALYPSTRTLPLNTHCTP